MDILGSTFATAAVGSLAPAAVAGGIPGGGANGLANVSVATGVLPSSVRPSVLDTRPYTGSSVAGMGMDMPSAPIPDHLGDIIGVGAHKSGPMDKADVRSGAGPRPRATARNAAGVAPRAPVTQRSAERSAKPRTDPYAPLRRRQKRDTSVGHSLHESFTGCGNVSNRIDRTSERPLHPASSVEGCLTSLISSQDHRMVLSGLHSLRTWALAAGDDRGTSLASGVLNALLPSVSSAVATALSYFSLRSSAEVDEVLAAILLTLRRVPAISASHSGVETGYEVNYVIATSVSLLVADGSLADRPSVAVQLCRFLCAAPFPVRISGGHW